MFSNQDHNCYIYISVMPYLIPNNSDKCRFLLPILGNKIGIRLFHCLQLCLCKCICIYLNIWQYTDALVLFSLFHLSNSASFLLAKYSCTITSKTYSSRVLFHIFVIRSPITWHPACLTRRPLRTRFKRHTPGTFGSVIMYFNPSPLINAYTCRGNESSMV